jgi:hypothetical protein
VIAMPSFTIRRPFEVPGDETPPASGALLAAGDRRVGGIDGTVAPRSPPDLCPNRAERVDILRRVVPCTADRGLHPERERKPGGPRYSVDRSAVGGLPLLGARRPAIAFPAGKRVNARTCARRAWRGTSAARRDDERRMQGPAVRGLDDTHSARRSGGASLHPLSASGAWPRRHSKLGDPERRRPTRSCAGAGRARTSRARRSGRGGRSGVAAARTGRPRSRWTSPIPRAPRARGAGSARRPRRRPPSDPGRCPTPRRASRARAARSRRRSAADLLPRSPHPARRAANP